MVRTQVVLLTPSGTDTDFFPGTFLPRKWDFWCSLQGFYELEVLPAIQLTMSKYWRYLGGLLMFCSTKWLTVPGHCDPGTLRTWDIRYWWQCWNLPEIVQLGCQSVRIFYHYYGSAEMSGPKCLRCGWCQNIQVIRDCYW